MSRKSTDCLFPFTRPLGIKVRRLQNIKETRPHGKTAVILREVFGDGVDNKSIVEPFKIPEDEFLTELV